MMERKLSEIAQMCGGSMQGVYDPVIRDISTDSRTAAAGSLFIPIRGERFDGHDFIDRAIERGAAAFVTSRETDSAHPYIIVSDTLNAYHDIAKEYFGSFNIRRIAITGSSGKTSVKDFISSCIAGNVLKTSGNTNNLIGVPANLLRADSYTEVSVIEMGMNQKGELSLLSDIYKPQIIIYTSINTSHIGNFSSFDSLIDAKLEILDHADNAVVIANGDDNHVLKRISERTKVITYGMSSHNDHHPESFELKPTETAVRIEGRDYMFPVPGAGGLYTFLAGFALAESGAVEMDIQRGLNDFRQPRSRMNIINTGRVLIIDDSYNASPASMENAINVLSRFSGRRVAVLSDMLELGNEEEKAHIRVRDMLKGNADVIFAYGKLAEMYCEDSGIESHFALSQDELENMLKQGLRDGDTVLVKGSHSMNMERIAQYIKECFNAV